MDSEDAQTEGLMEDLELAYSWTFHFRTRRLVVPEDRSVSAKQYRKAIVKLTEFDTVLGFWAAWSATHFQVEIPLHSNFYMFKSSVFPRWEDPANRNGGAFMMKLVDKTYTEQLWLDTLLAAVGNRCPHMDSLVGVVLAVRQFHDYVHVWLDTTDVEVVDSLADWLLELHPECPELKWRPHSAQEAEDILAARCGTEEALNRKTSSSGSVLVTSGFVTVGDTTPEELVRLLSAGSREGSRCLDAVMQEAELSERIKSNRSVLSHQSSLLQLRSRHDIILEDDESDLVPNSASMASHDSEMESDSDCEPVIRHLGNEITVEDLFAEESQAPELLESLLPPPASFNAITPPDGASPALVSAPQSPSVATELTREMCNPVVHSGTAVVEECEPGESIPSIMTRQTDSGCSSPRLNLVPSTPSPDFSQEWHTVSAHRGHSSSEVLSPVAKRSMAPPKSTRDQHDRRQSNPFEKLKSKSNPHHPIVQQQHALSATAEEDKSSCSDEVALVEPSSHVRDPDAEILESSDNHSPLESRVFRFLIVGALCIFVLAFFLSGSLFKPQMDHI